MRKYEDESAVLDLIARKTADGLWASNPDFPNAEDPPVYSITSIKFLKYLDSF